MDANLLERLFSVRGKTVLVTGGAGGIGQMLARTYLEAGARVYISGRRQQALDAALPEMQALGECHALQGDLGDIDGTRSIVDAFLSRESRLNVLVNNAGTTWGAAFGEFPDDAWDGIMHVNVRAPFALVQGLAGALAAAATDEDPSRVINIGSVYGQTAEVMNAFSYTASKAAIHQLTRVLARELAPRRILVNAIAPGLFPSKMTRFVLRDPSLRDSLVSRIPLSRPGSAEDIGGLALYLSSRAGAYMTGNVIPLDGGILVRE